MAKLTALIHTHEAADAQRLARALDSLRCCDEMLVINHGSHPEIDAVARDHGAAVKAGVPGVSLGTYLVDARHDWILCLQPQEAISEALEAALFHWKDREPSEAAAVSLTVREQNGSGQWRELGPQTRIANRNKVNWTTELPAPDESAELLEGDLLRFDTP